MPGLHLSPAGTVEIHTLSKLDRGALADYSQPRSSVLDPSREEGFIPCSNRSAAAEERTLLALAEEEGSIAGRGSSRNPVVTVGVPLVDCIL